MTLGNLDRGQQELCAQPVINNFVRGFKAMLPR